jgi:hypothetical protein
MRRRARATPAFFDRLDTWLPAERPGDGTPSRSDFEALDLFDIIEHFAEHWDNLLRTVQGRDDYRTHIAAGKVVASYAVTAQLAPDGVIELVDIEIQVRW